MVVGLTKNISAARYAKWVGMDGILCTLYVSVAFYIDGKSLWGQKPNEWLDSLLALLWFS